MSKIELGKTYRTRDGRAVRIYAVDHLGYYTVGGAIQDGCGNWMPASWPATGQFNKDGRTNKDDLIEVRPRIKREVWVNVYPAGPGYLTKADADYGASGERIACVKLTIDCEEGEGLA